MQRWDFSDRAENEAWPHCLNFPVHLLINTDSAEWILPSLCKQMAWVQFTSIIDSNFTLIFSTTQQPACSWSAYHIYFCFDLFCFTLLPIFHSKYSPMTECNFPVGALVNINRQTLSEHSIDTSVKYLYFTAMSFCYLFIWVLVRLPKFLWKT